MIRSIAGFIFVAALSGLTLAGGTGTAFAQDHSGHAPGDQLPHNVPNLCSGPNVTSTASGAWSNPSTWSPARIPSAGDRVLISSGHNVTFDAMSDAHITCVAIEGRLNFRTDANTRLTVGTLMVLESGFLWIGDASTPVSASVTAEIVIADQPLDPSTDPDLFGTGLIAFGKVRMHGAVKTSFARLSAEARAGQTALNLGAPLNGWRSSDRLVIPDTRHLRNSEIEFGYASQLEERLVSGAAGNTVTLQSGLAYDHRGSGIRGGTPEFLPHVANITRNIIVRSASPSQTVRGHVQFIHRADVDIRYAAFRNLGRTTTAPLNCTLRTAGVWQEPFNCASGTGAVTHIGTNQIGRYPLHLHHVLGPQTSTSGYQFVLVGNAIEAAPKWGITLHAAHYGLVQDNVIYDVGGASLVTEDGSESYNLIQNNFAVKGYGEGGREGGAREGVGFYFRGPNNWVRNNVATNFIGGGADANYGFKYFLNGTSRNIRIPTTPGQDPAAYETRDVFATPILQFDDNEVYGATESGLTFWWIGTEFMTPRDNVPESVIRRLRVWNVHNKGVFTYQSNRVTIDGLIVRGNWTGDSACCGIGIEGVDYLTANLRIKNSDIQGMRVGYQPSSFNTTPIYMEDSVLANVVDVAVPTLWISDADSSWIPSRRLVLRNVRFGGGISVQMIYTDDISHNLIQSDTVQVISYNGVPGDDFQVYYSQQAPGFVVPQTIMDGAYKRKTGAPLPGLSNSQSWQQFGLAVAGAIAPCSQVRARFENAFVCDLSSVPPPPPPDSDADGVSNAFDRCPGTPRGTSVDATGCPVTNGPPVTPPSAPPPVPTPTPTPTPGPPASSAVAILSPSLNARVSGTVPVFVTVPAQTSELWVELKDTWGVTLESWGGAVSPSQATSTLQVNVPLGAVMTANYSLVAVALVNGERFSSQPVPVRVDNASSTPTPVPPGPTAPTSGLGGAIASAIARKQADLAGRASRTPTANPARGVESGNAGGGSNGAKQVARPAAVPRIRSCQQPCSTPNTVRSTSSTTGTGSTYRVIGDVHRHRSKAGDSWVIVSGTMLYEVVGGLPLTMRVAGTSVQAEVQTVKNVAPKVLNATVVSAVTIVRR